MNLYENLIIAYPDNAKFKLDLIELYWADLDNDNDHEVRREIERLLIDIRKLPLIESQVLNVSTVSYKILLAKYEFYINGNTKESLESLYEIQAKSDSYGYKMIEEMVSKQITNLEKDFGWDEKDVSLKERIDKLKFKSYIEGARSLLDADFNF